jgi:hypothetical protein
MRRLLVLGASLALLALGGCGKPKAPPVADSLLPPETFEFAPQAVSFAPPAAPWAAEKELSGGLRGVRYVKVGGVGEAIGVADFYDVSRRFPQAALDRLLETDPGANSRDFELALRDAWCRPNPYTALERDTCAVIDAELHRAVAARNLKDYDTVRDAVATARVAADRLRLSLADVLDRAMFDPEASPSAQQYSFVGRRDTTIGGEPAVVVDYTLDLREGRRHVRKAYVMHHTSLFVAEFIGLESTLPLFDKVVASIAFPP